VTFLIARQVVQCPYLQAPWPPHPPSVRPFCAQSQIASYSAVTAFLIYRRNSHAMQRLTPFRDGLKHVTAIIVAPVSVCEIAKVGRNVKNSCLKAKFKAEV